MRGSEACSRRSRRARCWCSRWNTRRGSGASPGTRCRPSRPGAPGWNMSCPGLASSISSPSCPQASRCSPALRSLLAALHAERRTLFGCLVILAGAVLLFASLLYAIERNVQPDKFGTIPQAMWWAIVTLGTVGYGDVVPVTPLGKIVSVFAIVVGFAMIALPVAIVSRAFTDEVRRRDFIVTWGMLARVPLFSHLGASEIVDIMRLLRAQTIEAREVLVRRGDPASSMYFITAGEVEIELPSQRVRLSHGTFFGEIALLQRTKRSGTVTATCKTKLLALEAKDFH